MSAVGNAMPLLALDAVAVDTETTALDPKRARVVEIAAVRLLAGRIAGNLRSLVNPGEPIPAETTRIHGIDDAKVAGAPPFGELWPTFSAFVRDSLWVGHALGFDFAVLERECARTGRVWTRPRALDTRLLAEVAEPELADFSMERIAAWLGVDVTDRHSALGDALTAARIFQALVPRLRERGVRTVGEAAQACRTVAGALDAGRRLGWGAGVVTAEPVETEPDFGRIDSFPYRHRIRDIMRRPPEFIAADAPLRDALVTMMQKRISAVYVHANPLQPVRAADSGIVTERDVLRAVVEGGSGVLDTPVNQIASRPLVGVPADAFVYRAVGRMNRLNVRHLAALDHSGRVVGALFVRDLLRLRASEAVSLGDEIEAAGDLHDLAVAWAKLPVVARALIAEGVPGRDIAGAVSQELCALTGAAGRIAEQRMQERGRGAPPCPYALAVLGSGGRGESLLAMDQDNALVFADGAPEGSEDRWFADFAADVADILHAVGVPYCKGGVMAKSASWRGSVATWKARIVDWIGRSRPQDLLAVDIFFDLRPVHGELGLADSLWRSAFDAARGNAAFAKLLADAAGTVEPGLNLFGGIRTDRGRINLKKAGLFGVVSTARVLAICHHVVRRSTPARLAGIEALGIGGKHDLALLGEAQRTFLDLLVAQQVEDLHGGIPPSNAVEIKRLNEDDRQRLHNALSAVSHLDQLTRDLLFAPR
jgi:DNA polymerase-3 subunit epsilon/CBS domain-containing protein